MRCLNTARRLVVRYVHDDRDQRQVFRRKLAGYLRGQRDRWNITTFVEALDLLGHDVDEIRLTLRRRPGARLAVTIDYELPPIHSDQAAR